MRESGSLSWRLEKSQRLRDRKLETASLAATCWKACSKEIGWILLAMTCQLKLSAESLFRKVSKLVNTGLEKSQSSN